MERREGEHCITQSKGERRKGENEGGRMWREGGGRRKQRSC